MEWDFSANQEIDDDTLAKAPEGFRAAYAKGDDGKYRISDTHKPFVDAISGLGTALKAERNVSKDLKGKKDVAAVIKESLGFDTIEDAKAKLDELTQAVATSSKVDPAKIKADIEKVFNAQLADKDKELGTMKGTLQRYMIEAGAVSALAAAKGNAKLLMPLIREQVELVADGDEYVVRVKDGAGDYRGNGKGGFMSVDELVAEMKASKDYAGAFESDNGGGTQQQQGRKPGDRQRQQLNNQQNRENMNSSDRIAAGLAARRNR